MVVIPDIHGRTFWKDAVNGRKEDEIIFLGDYLDPYNDENISAEESVNNFKEIIEFKKARNNNVILLLGNHDVHYFMDDVIQSTRKSRFYEREIAHLFFDNDELFQMCYEKNIGGKRVLFSHAGVLRDWANIFFPDVPDDKICDYLNNAYLVGDKKLGTWLSTISNFRGGNSYAGSCIWADVHEHLNDYQKQVADYQVFGHTQLIENPIVTDRFACLDVRRVFIISPVFTNREHFEISEQDGTRINVI